MRLPNPWIGIPVAIAAVGGAIVGFVVMSASCSPGSCLVPAVAVAVAVGTVAAVGVGVVVVLALRSLAEYRDGLDRDVLAFVDDVIEGSGVDVPVAATVSPADERHVDGISRFLERAWREAGPGALGWTGASDEVIASLAEPEAVRMRLADPERRTFVAISEDEVVALASTRRVDEWVAELSGIVVLQSMVGSGIGTPLLELAASTAAAEGYRSLHVATESSNERALRFYRSRGFTERTTETREVEGSTVEVTVLQRKL